MEQEEAVRLELQETLEEQVRESLEATLLPAVQAQVEAEARRGFRLEDWSVGEVDRRHKVRATSSCVPCVPFALEVSAHLLCCSMWLRHVRSASGRRTSSTRSGLTGTR